jgi:hypothetical protein
MYYILILSGVSLLIGFYLGVLVMGLVKIASHPVPVPDSCHVHPLRQEQDSPLRQGQDDQVGRARHAHDGDTISTRPTIRSRPIAWMRDGVLAAWTVAVIFCFSVMAWVLQSSG